jgi:hypothetical protein
VTASINCAAPAIRGTESSTPSTFDVLARRADTRGARDVNCPILDRDARRQRRDCQARRHGGIDFADGQDRATGHAKAASYVDRAQATLPEGFATASAASGARAMPMPRSIRWRSPTCGRDRARHVRAAGRLPADRPAADVQRHAMTLVAGPAAIAGLAKPPRRRKGRWMMIVPAGAIARFS